MEHLEQHIREILEFIGEDSTRDGLKDTPRRILKALAEMTSGYKENPKEILSRTFDVDHDEMIILKGIEFTSLCEHHILPIIGTAKVGYLPGKVVGISKLARLVQCFARRLQVQERMTNQIASAIADHLEARGVGVIVTAKHGCMTCRGVRQEGAEMVTSAMLGEMRHNQAARLEFLSL